MTVLIYTRFRLALLHLGLETWQKYLS